MEVGIAYEPLVVRIMTGYPEIVWNHHKLSVNVDLLEQYEMKSTRRAMAEWQG